MRIARILFAITALAAFTLMASAQEVAEAPANYTHITNVNIFDGIHSKLATGSGVLIKNSLIIEVGKSIGDTERFDADPEYKPINTINRIMKDGKIYKNTL